MTVRPHAECSLTRISGLHRIGGCFGGNSKKGATMDEQLAFAPASELSDLITSKQVSPVGMTELYFSRIDTLDSHLNSYT